MCRDGKTDKTVGMGESEFKGDEFSLSYTGNEKTWRRTVNRCWPCVHGNKGRRLTHWLSLPHTQEVLLSTWQVCRVMSVISCACIVCMWTSGVSVHGKVRLKDWTLLRLIVYLPRLLLLYTQGFKIPDMHAHVFTHMLKHMFTHECHQV